jgi:hypothetical protein
MRENGNFIGVSDADKKIAIANINTNFDCTTHMFAANITHAQNAVIDESHSVLMVRDPERPVGIVKEEEPSCSPACRGHWMVRHRSVVIGIKGRKL